jgi:hypothetical protein
MRDCTLMFVSLSHVLALKFGYEDVTAMKKDAKRRFSLLENGILNAPSARALLINVSHDSLSSFTYSARC